MTAVPRKTILVVDDASDNIAVLTDILGHDYRVVFAMNGTQALTRALAATPPDLILLDVVMPGMDGYEVCRRLKADLRTQGIPVIFVTAQSGSADEATGLELGAVDYLLKSSHPAIIRQRVRIHLDLHDQNQALEARVRERTAELEDTRREIVRRLGRAGEYRDNETGMHVMRMSQYCHRLALAAGIPPTQAEQLLLAAPMHDIGKIGIPDHILLKPGRFDDDERRIMQRHTEIGASIIGDGAVGLLGLARTVAISHHERWDGQGYPGGLAGEAIPFEGRISAISDVFDALTSARPYKRAWSFDDAVAYIEGERGKAFDPTLVDHFRVLLPEFARIRERYAEGLDPRAAP